VIKGLALLACLRGEAFDIDALAPAEVCRHAFATQLSAGGVPFKEITALLGQSGPGETERYVHRLSDQTLAQRARTAIDQAFPAAGPTLAEHGTD
jgi:site-specific recombinase XerD